MINLIMSQLQTIIVTFPIMRSVFIKEYSDRMYGVMPFFFSKMAVELYDEFVNASLVTLLIYWVAELNPEVSHFFTFYFITMLLSMTGSSFGIMCGCMFSRVDIAVSIAPMISFPFVYFCGFLRNNGSIPIAFR